jgi:2-phosphosulfolactate phosphatase
MTFDQAEFEVRCEWGRAGLRELAPISEVIIIVDVLSFSTAVDIATGRGGIVFPYPLNGEPARNYAASVHANLASDERNCGYSLSPASLVDLPAGYRLVLASPNGAALAFSAHGTAVFTACFRNATAVGQMATRLGSAFAVIPAGERWASGELRPSLEDWIAAGAVISSLAGRRSPEANLAALTFEQVRRDLFTAVRQASSGKELMERDHSADVELACELDVSGNVPRLVDRAFASYKSNLP